MKPTRIVVYPKDIMIITGKSLRHAQLLFHKIKKHYNKEPHQVLTISEVAEYLGIRKEEIII